MHIYITTSQKKYVCFIDLQKFSLWKTDLLCKFGKLGIGKNMLNIIKNQFENILGSFKYQNMQSIFFLYDQRCKAKRCINPTLFNIFLNDIGKFFEQNCNDPLELTDSQYSLLFADDLIVLSKCKTGLQNSLDNLSDYCGKWQLTVNVKKPKTMILQNNCGNPPNSQFVKFKDNFLENAKEYKYLGCMIDNNGNLVNSSLDLSKKTETVLFSIKHIHLILVRFQLR